MSEQNKNPLASFMKKQISEKSSKNNLSRAGQKKSPGSIGGKQKANKENSQEEEMSEEEQLQEAKKASRYKAAGHDQSEMIKKLFIESIAKYTLLIAVLVIFAIGMIELGPTLLSLLNGLIFKVLMGALQSK